jgi:cold shock CspA family protein
MAQGTVKDFDPVTNTGTVMLDTKEEVPVDAETFAISGLRELRLGQRVTFELEDRDGAWRMHNLGLVSI